VTRKSIGFAELHALYLDRYLVALTIYVAVIPFAPFFLQHSSFLLNMCLLYIVETVRGQREHARKCSGAHCNHQQQT
jgi:hypothetical protein